MQTQLGAPSLHLQTQAGQRANATRIPLITKPGKCPGGDEYDGANCPATSCRAQLRRESCHAGFTFKTSNFNDIKCQPCFPYLLWGAKIANTCGYCAVFIHFSRASYEKETKHVKG